MKLSYRGEMGRVIELMGGVELEGDESKRVVGGCDGDEGDIELEEGTEIRLPCLLCLLLDPVTRCCPVSG